MYEKIKHILSLVNQERSKLMIMVRTTLWIGMIATIVCTVAIVIRFFFFPVTGVDPGSVIGLVTSILGIAATVLALMGAFAVAAWWQELDKKVKGHAKTLIDDAVKIQKEDFQKEISQLQALIGITNKQLALSATIFAPWDAEEWAQAFLRINPQSEITHHMMVRYLQEVEAFLPLGKRKLPSAHKGLRVYHGYPIQELWKKALEWQQKVIEQGDEKHIEAIRKTIDEIRPAFEEHAKKEKNNPQQ